MSSRSWLVLLVFFFFNDTATTEIYTLSLHDALPILASGDIEELIEDGAWTLDLAERYQTPVIHLVDKALAVSSRTVPLPHLDAVTIDRGGPPGARPDGREAQAQARDGRPRDPGAAQGPFLRPQGPRAPPRRLGLLERRDPRGALDPRVAGPFGGVPSAPAPRAIPRVPRPRCARPRRDLRGRRGERIGAACRPHRHAHGAPRTPPPREDERPPHRPRRGCRPRRADPSRDGG